MNPSAASGRRAAAKMTVAVAARDRWRKPPRRAAMVEDVHCVLCSLCFGRRGCECQVKEHLNTCAGLKA